MSRLFIVGIAILLTIPFLICGEENSSQSDIISLPLSPINEKNVYSIPPSSTILHKDGFTVVYEPTKSKMILNISDSQAEIISTPFGPKKASYVHQLPDGSFIHKIDDKTTEVYVNDECILTVINENNVREKEYNDWIEYAYNLRIDEISEFTAYWEVPEEPPSPGRDALDYIFNGIQPQDESSIVQPVLEYNYDGSDRWTVAPWAVVNGDDAFTGHRFDVDEDDRLMGRLLWNLGDREWYIEIKDLTSNHASTMESDLIETDYDLEVFLALEGYHIESDNDVCSDITFHDIITKDEDGDDIDIEWHERVVPEALSYLTELNVKIERSQIILETAN
jgi:hypothetical protein